MSSLWGRSCMGPTKLFSLHATTLLASRQPLGSGRSPAGATPLSLKEIISTGLAHKCANTSILGCTTVMENNRGQSVVPRQQGVRHLRGAENKSARLVYRVNHCCIVCPDKNIIVRKWKFSEPKQLPEVPNSWHVDTFLTAMPPHRVPHPVRDTSVDTTFHEDILLMGDLWHNSLGSHQRRHDKMTSLPVWFRGYAVCRAAQFAPQQSLTPSCLSAVKSFGHAVCHSVLRQTCLIWNGTHFPLEKGKLLTQDHRMLYLLLRNFPLPGDHN